MNLVVNGIDVEVDDRYVKTPLLWVLRYVFGTPGSEQTSQESTAQDVGRQPLDGGTT